MKKEVPHQKGNQESQRSKVNIEARKPKRKSIQDIHLHNQIRLIAILMG